MCERCRISSGHDIDVLIMVLFLFYSIVITCCVLSKSGATAVVTGMIFYPLIAWSLYISYKIKVEAKKNMSNKSIVALNHLCLIPYTYCIKPIYIYIVTTISIKVWGKYLIYPKILSFKPRLQLHFWELIFCLENVCLYSRKCCLLVFFSAISSHLVFPTYISFSHMGI